MIEKKVVGDTSGIEPERKRSASRTLYMCR